MRQKGGLGAAGSRLAVFPVALVEAVLEAFNAPCDLVFEPFGSSETQLIAAKRTGRRCRAVELDPAYCDVAVRRWEMATGGGQARLVPNARKPFLARLERPGIPSSLGRNQQGDRTSMEEQDDVLGGRKRKPGSVTGLEALGRERLSRHFFMRDFLYSEIGNFFQIQNIPDDPNLALHTGRKLASELLDPLVETFGPIAVRSAYRSPSVNGYGAAHNLGCASNEANRAAHIWDQRDAEGNCGACTSVVIPWFADQYEKGRDWQDLAWWLYDHLDFHAIFFFPKRAAFNLTWRQNPERRISSWIGPNCAILRPGDTPPSMEERQTRYADFPTFRGIQYPELPERYRVVNP